MHHTDFLSKSSISFAYPTPTATWPAVLRYMYE